MEFPTVTRVAVLYFVALIFVFSCFIDATPIAGIDVEKHPEVNITPIAPLESDISRNDVRCARTRVSGLSRLKLGSYSSAHRVNLVPSPKIHERLYKKIQICVHSNSSLGLCQCENDYWENIQNGMWSSIISPYGDRYIDVKFVDNLSGSVTIGVKEEFQRWRLACLFIGLVVLLAAPIVSGWVPFYYSSSMAIGICLVVLILLFQGMKLLPTGRKTAFYSTIYGLAIGAGSFLLNRLSTFINSILVNFGISKEMHNPVLVFIIVGIVLAGAAFGYWLVRKFVVTEDGTVDVGIAQFVKWALRIISVTFILQSTLDTPLAMAVLLCILGIHCSFTSKYCLGLGDFTYSGYEGPWGWNSEKLNSKKRTEFLSRSRTMKSGGTSWKRPVSSPAWANSPVKGIISPSSRRNARSPSLTGVVSPSSRRILKSPSSIESADYPSTYHRKSDHKKFSEEEWKEFTEESTKHAIAELASSPEFTDWIVNNADRIRYSREDSSDGSFGSGSDSTDEKVAESSSRRGLTWRRW